MNRHSEDLLAHGKEGDEDQAREDNNTAHEQIHQRLDEAMKNLNKLRNQFEKEKQKNQEKEKEKSGKSSQPASPIHGRVSNPNPSVTYEEPPTSHFNAGDLIIKDQIETLKQKNIEASDTAKELRQMLDEFFKEKIGLESDIDRKVDREIVERLFNKFRLMLKSLNDKLNNLHIAVTNCATISDLENLIQVIQNKDSLDKSSALRRAHTCLFCGKPRNSVVGQLTPDEAVNSFFGGQTVQNVVNDGPTIVYGEGGAFKADPGESLLHVPLPDRKSVV